MSGDQVVSQVRLPPIARALMFHAHGLESFAFLRVPPRVRRTFHRRSGFVTLIVDFRYASSFEFRLIKALRVELIYLGFTVEQIDGVCLLLTGYRGAFDRVAAERAHTLKAAA